MTSDFWFQMFVLSLFVMAVLAVCAGYVLRVAGAQIERLKTIASNAVDALGEAERERDACISDITQFQGVTCNACKHHYRPQPEVRHYECEIFGKFSDVFENEEGPLMCGKFEWRGPCPENTKEASNEHP